MFASGHRGGVWFTTLAVGCVAGLALVGCRVEPNGTTSTGGTAAKRPRIAFVTNCVASFWVIAEKGVQDAGKELDAEVSVLMPPRQTSTEQKRMVEDALARGVDGMAISPVDPANQADLLKTISENAILITQDSDAPESPRRCYIGMDNYDAGWLCGELIQQALPEGGAVALFVGNLEQINSKGRRQGIIDCLLERTKDPTRYDPPGTELKSALFTILDTFTDQGDLSQAKAKAQDAIAKFPTLNCMVGLFAYNPPKILGAVREANKLGQIQVIGFDEDPETLQAIVDQQIFGTVVQDPYRYGFESVRVLAGLIRGDETVLPAGGVLSIPARKVTGANVVEFWTQLKALTESPSPAVAP